MRGTHWVLCAALLFGGCASTTFNVPPGAANEQLYAAAYPYYVEFCALSEIRKLPGSAVDIEGGTLRPLSDGTPGSL